MSLDTPRGSCLKGAGCTSPRSKVKIAVFGITQSVRRRKPFFSSKVSFSALRREKLKPRVPRLVYFSGPIPVFRGASPYLLRRNSPGLNNYRKRKITLKTRSILRCWLPIYIYSFSLLITSYSEEWKRFCEAPYCCIHL